MASEGNQLNRSLNEEASDSEQETVDRLRAMSELIDGVANGVFSILNTLKSYEEKGRSDQRMYRGSMSVHGQCLRQLYNLEGEFNNFRNTLARAEQEMCASNQLFDELTSFIKQAQPVIFKWEALTSNIIKDIKQLKSISRKRK